jgi:hypothetical protein
MTLVALPKNVDYELLDLLAQKSKESGRDWKGDWAHSKYVQDDNNDALSEEWLDKKTSYIWRVGALIIWDANKCDWCGIWFGQRREPNYKIQFKGSMYWDDGENDDPARTVRRVMELAAQVHSVFVED